MKLLDLKSIVQRESKELKVEFTDWSTSTSTSTSSTSASEVYFFDIPMSDAILSASANLLYTVKKDTEFIGYCLDSGAAKSVVVENQYNELCKELGLTLKFRPSITMFRFGATKFRSAGYFRTRLRVSHELFIKFVVYIVTGDFPMLVGLDVMRRQGLTLNLNSNVIYDETGG